MRQSLFVISAVLAFFIFSASTSIDNNKEISKCPYLQNLHEAKSNQTCPYLKKMQHNTMNNSDKCPYLQEHEGTNKSSDEKQLKCPYQENFQQNKELKPAKAQNLKSI